MAEPSETPAQRRRRWITFGEIVGVLALVISAASLWDSHQGRVAETAAKPVPKAPALVLTAAPDGEARVLKIAAAGGQAVIQTQTVLFPKQLNVSAVDTVGNPRIDLGWFENQLHATAHKGDAKAKRRLPVGLVTRVLIDGQVREDRTVYDVGYSWRPRFMRDDTVMLEGITLVSRGGDVQARVDARWAIEHPAKTE